MVRNLLQLIRWKNLVIAGGTVLLTKYAIFEPAINTLFPFSSSSLNFIETLLLAISVMSIAAGGYIINDINDIKTDQINKPEKVIIGKQTWVSSEIGRLRIHVPISSSKRFMLPLSSLKTPKISPEVM